MISCSCTTLDTSGLLCPEPVMLLHQAIGKMKAQQWIMLISTDPTSVRDVAHFCQFLHHKLLATHRLQHHNQGFFVYLIEKKKNGR